MSASMEVRLGCDVGEIAGLAEQIEDFGEQHALPSKIVFNLNLALDELITNAISYGLKDNAANGLVRVKLSLADGVLTAEITVNGTAFDPFAEAPPPDLESGVDDRPIGGLGVHLVKTLIGDVAYRREGGHNVVLLRQPVGE